MKTLLLLHVFIFIAVPIAYAIDQQQPLTDSGTLQWKFCSDTKRLDYKVFNGTLHDTVHLRLFDAPDCKTPDETEFQFQIFHKSNNHTDFTLSVPHDLEDKVIDVRVVGHGYVETHQFNSTFSTLQFSDFIHDRNGLVAIILDYRGDN